MERICDACGQKKELRGGKTCERGRFVCKITAPRVSASWGRVSQWPL